MGHAPMFAIPDFADFSQEIGLASLGATDEQITQLARLYWFTIEFGLSTENGERKALGAGLLSSFGELEYSMDLKEERPTVLNFDPFDVVKRDYPITTYQPIYYQAKSIHDLKLKIKEYLRTMPRSFSTSYDFKTQQVLVDRNLIVKPQESFKS